VGQGNHKVLNADGKPLESQILQNLELLHFPIRSTEQLLAKGVIGWEANQARENLKSKPAAAYQWKRLHDIAERGEHPTSEVLMSEALNYAQKEKIGAVAEHVVPEAHGISQLRRYSDGKSAPADKLIAASRKKTSGMTAPLDLPGGPKGAKADTDVTNAFQGAWHWDFLFLDEPPIRYALERFAPKSVLDLGCGSGLYPALYSHLGASDVLGIDGLELEATVLTSDQYAKADLQEPYDAGRRFDMVVCLEVVEHINPEATETLLDSIAHHAKGQILFSMAEPGQPGNGHINCQGISNVLAFWAKRGWQPDLAATLGLRAVSSMSWFRRNIVLLQHTGETAETAAARALRKIGDLSYVWYPQAPGQRITAFSEPYPDLESSYGLLLPPMQKAD
jgi:SAM-dependent methyltransferase